MSTDGRIVRWVGAQDRYEISIPRGQRADVQPGATLECWLRGRGPVHVTLGDRVRGGRFLCATPLKPPLAEAAEQNAFRQAFDAGVDARRRNGWPSDNPYRQGTRWHDEWLRGYVTPVTD